MVWRPCGDQILAVHQQNIEPAVAVDIEKGAARPHRFRQPLLARAPGVVREMDAGRVRDVGEPDRR